MSKKKNKSDGKKSRVIDQSTTVVTAPPLVCALTAVLDKVRAAQLDPDAVEMVHDARKAMKEYRALLRLIPGQDARQARHEVAAAARGLAHARDRATAQEALQMLQQAGLAREEDIALAQKAIGADHDDAQEADHLRELLRIFLEDADARLAMGLARQAAEADLVSGLRRAYRAARKADFAEDKETGRAAPHAMHEARKRVVTHRYQMSFVAAWFGGKGSKRAIRAQRLRDALGAYQDIETLRPLLDAVRADVPEGTLARLERAMKRLQKRLEKQARKQHARLFRRSSRGFAQHIQPLGTPTPPPRIRTAADWHVLPAEAMEVLPAEEMDALPAEPGDGELEKPLPDADGTPDTGRE
ncbi:CHAD domain-containing protein [Xanthobacter sp. TB0139]|uniref:CHAD domain-containing protein n=1 Tax=Xanthobacter sp. TB0139 TaxID=3459178 RepID=UPI0040390F75